MLKFKVCFIGAGKLAYSLLPALSKVNINTELIISRDINSAKDLAKQNNVNKFSDKIIEDLEFCNLFFLSVPDDQIKKVAEELSSTIKNFPNKIFIHFSGAKNTDELKTLFAKGGRVASIHVMQTFSDKKPVDISKSYFAVETNSQEDGKMLLDVFSKIFFKGFIINRNEKIFYHLMGIFASNILVEVFYNIEKLSKYIDSETPHYYLLLESIINQTLKNIKEKGAVQSLSGPIERGDIETIKNHIEAIKNDKDLYSSYITSMRNLVDVAFEKGRLNKNQVQKLKEILITNNL